MMQPLDYQWILIVGGIFAFLDAFGIGANDVANSFANSVGARSITIGMACAIAVFTEFGGAILLGAETTSTIKDGIIETAQFKGSPEVLMLGFLCALIGSATWVLTASRFGWPVSTTHSIIGGISGFAITAVGVDAIQWKPLSKIFISWVASPLLAGIMASIIFLATKYSVMTSKNSLQRGINSIPIFFTIVLGILTFFLINKAPKGINLSKKGLGTTENWTKVLTITAITSVAIGVLTFVFLVPFFRRKLVDEEDLKWYHAFMPWSSKQPINTDLARQMAIRSGEIKEESEKKDMAEASKPKGGLWGFLSHGVNVDVVSVRSDRLQAVHDKAEKFDSKTEYLFSFLQVCTAAFASFAHGSNDVANAAGPLSAIYTIYDTGTLPVKDVNPVPFVILAGMGIAIDLGLVLYGYNIMRKLGNNVTYQSPSRGFSMELGAAMTVIIASFMGIPVSTTHCITGATVAVGLCNGEAGAINWKMVSWTISSWVLTLPIAGAISGVFYLILKSTIA